MAKDLHIIRYFSSLVTVSNARVIKITKPAISYCPLAGFLYKGLKGSVDLPLSRLKAEIAGVIEGKISRFGFCTKDRMIWKDEAVIPYGASEILANGLRSGAIDSTVTVCDGAGTVITAVPQVVQGIGARMHTIIRTSYISEVAIKLHRCGCDILNKKALIDQRAGVIKAAKKGSKKIAVSVRAFGGENLDRIRLLEKSMGVSVTILAVCTTGIGENRLAEVERNADMVWACNCGQARERLSKHAIKILSGVSPVYVLTEKGKKLISGYAPNVSGIRKQVSNICA